MSLSLPSPWQVVRRLVTPTLAAALLLGCAAGTQPHGEGMSLVAAGQRDAGLERLKEAARIDPTNAQFRIDLLREQMLYARELLERADDARRTGNMAEARELYQHALKVQPGNERASRGVASLMMDQRHATLLAEAETALKEGQVETARNALRTILTENPGNESAQRASAMVAELQARQEQQRAREIAAQSILRKPVTLQFRDANLRMVFEALSRSTGLNVILDRDVKADLKTTIFVKDATVEDTVDLILLQNQLEKRTLNATTLFVYPATPAKQKEYQDLQVRTFQIANGDAKYLQTLLKSVLKLKEASVDERNNTISVRDTPEAVAVAAKVIAANDQPDAEVMLEVEVLEITRTRASNIGLQLPSSFGVATPSSANTIGALRGLTRNDLTATGLSATLNLQLQDTDTNTLASPRIRARNKEKAKILIGDRVPTITNSVTPIQSGGSVVTGSVQYQEVGLKLEFEPQIYNAQEVGIKISLEVSNIANTFTDPQGGRSYQIGTRSASTSLRLRDGETQVLGGLISDQDRNTAAKIPGLGHLPVVGSVFGNNDSSKTKTEIVLSITPRIVRAPANVEAALREIFSGTESSIRERPLRLDSLGDSRGTPAVRPATGAPAAGDVGSAASTPRPAPTPVTIALPPSTPQPATAPATPPAAAAPEAAASRPGPMAAVPPPAPPPVSAAAAAKPAAALASAQGDLGWKGPSSLHVGESFTVTLNAMGIQALKTLPLSVRFDPTVLRFEGAALGSLAEGAGAQPPEPSIDTTKGRLDIPMSFGKPGGLKGDGPLVELKFTVHTGRSSTQLISAQSEVEGATDGSHLLLPGPRSLNMRITR